MTKRAVLYARVSTDEQADKGYSLPTQLAACRQYAEEHGLIIVAEFRDDCSGTIRMADRPQGSQMLALLERGEANAVIIYTSDRLTRNLAHMLILREEWQRDNVELHYVNRGKSENTAESRMTENIEGVFAEYWREKIIEGSKRGRLAKAKDGKWVGACPAPYGYGRIGQGRNARLAIDEYESSIVLRIFSMYLGRNGYERTSIKVIAQTLNAEGVPPPRSDGRGWYPMTIYKCILHNRAYLGEFRYCGYQAFLPELAILDQETWDAAQKQTAHNKARAARNRKREYLLSSHIFCSCGRRLVGAVSSGRSKYYWYYRCGGQSNYGYLAECQSKSVPVDLTDNLVWEWIKSLLMDESTLDKGMQEMMDQQEAKLAPKRKRLETINEIIEKTDRKIKRLAVAIGDTDDVIALDALKAELKTSSKQKDLLIAESANLQKELIPGVLTEADRIFVRSRAAEIRQKLTDKPTYKQKRELLEVLNVRVQLQSEGNERYLHVTCGISVTGVSLTIEDTSRCENRYRARPDRANPIA